MDVLARLSWPHGSQNGAVGARAYLFICCGGWLKRAIGCASEADCRFARPAWISPHLPPVPDVHAGNTGQHEPSAPQTLATRKHQRAAAQGGESQARGKHPRVGGPLLADEAMQVQVGWVVRSSLCAATCRRDFLALNWRHSLLGRTHCGIALTAHHWQACMRFPWAA